MDSASSWWSSSESLRPRSQSSSLSASAGNESEMTRAWPCGITIENDFGGTARRGQSCGVTAVAPRSGPRRNAAHFDRAAVENATELRRGVGAVDGRVPRFREQGHGWRSPRQQGRSGSSAEHRAPAPRACSDLLRGLRAHGLPPRAPATVRAGRRRACITLGGAAAPATPPRW